MPNIGENVTVRGYITKEKYLLGQPLPEIEERLGFHFGRLSWGASFAAITRLPLPSEFELAAYSMTAEHRHKTPSGLNIPKLKSVARETWRTCGTDRLIKVYPVVGHNPLMDRDEQYPPGSGVPQWKVIGAGVPGVVVACLLPGMRYRPHR